MLRSHRAHTPTTKYQTFCRMAGPSRLPDSRSTVFPSESRTCLWISSTHSYPLVLRAHFSSKRHWHSKLVRSNFEIPMKNLELMQRPEPSRHLYKDAPDLAFGEGRSLLLVFDNLLIEISVVGVLHYDAEFESGFTRGSL